MTITAKMDAPDSGWSALRSEVLHVPWETLASEDLSALSWLHQAERSPEELQAFGKGGFPEALSLPASGHPAVPGMRLAIQALPVSRHELLQACRDDLAADFADIYLTHRLRAAPLESVWLDEDHLMLQGPTFAVRDFYRRHGVRVADWRSMPDDHLCHELNFVAILLTRHELQAASDFLHRHLMRWLPLFAGRVEQRSATRFYGALANLTLTCCESLQTRLPAPEDVKIIGIARQGVIPPGC